MTVSERYAELLAELEALGERWLEARAAGNLDATFKLNVEAVEVDKASRKLERKIRKGKGGEAV